MLKHSFSGGLKTQTDAVLLQLMAGTDETLREIAFTRFYNRHADTLHKLCLTVCQKYTYYYGGDLPDAVMHNTFLEVYHHPLEAFRHLDEQQDVTGKTLEADVLLSAMADKELQNELNRGGNEYVRNKVLVSNEAILDRLVLMKNYFSDEEEEGDEKQYAIADARASDLISLDHACEKLKPDDKKLIDFIKTYDLPGCYLPKEEKALFLNKTGLKRENFRKRKERVYLKLRKSVLNDRENI